MNNQLENKIAFLKQEFKKYNYNLSLQDKEDLKRRLISKPVQLYLLGIEFLKKCKAPISYANVKKLIIIDIRVRDNIKKVITSLEEALLVKYIDSKYELYDLEVFRKLKSSKNLSDIIKELKNKSNNLDQIRKIRNDVNHLVYPIIFNKFEQIIGAIKNLKQINFVENKIIDILLTKIFQVNDDIQLECVSKLFKNLL